MNLRPLHALVALIGLTTALLATAPRAHAQTTAITGITIAPGGARLSGDFTIGFEFTTTTSLLVSSLGVYDHDQDGLAGSHQVGIWRVSDQALLTSSTVTTTSALDGLFRYESVAPITLPAGNTYRIGALYTVAVGDFYLAEANFGGYTVASGLTFNRPNGAVFDTLGFAYPTQIAISRDGHFSANFKFTSSAAAPEPGSLALLGLGGVFVLGVVRRRKAV